MKTVIAVGSGKGGVGKSTVAVNLAAALANHPSRPQKVALIDVDFYGPSVPTLMGGGEIRSSADGKFQPAEKFNVKYISIGFFLKNADDPIIWRGPMFSKAIQQLFADVEWGEIDIAVVDLPPGTGDAQLSLAQQVQLSGVVMVSTPQEVALSDVRRAINMFRKVNVPVLGVVENMAGYRAPDGTILNIFGQGGGAQLAEQYDLPLLASLPIEIAVREGGDAGRPVALNSESECGRLFGKLAEDLIQKLETQPRPVELKVVN